MAQSRILTLSFLFLYKIPRPSVWTVLQDYASATCWLHYSIKKAKNAVKLVHSMAYKVQELQ